MKGFRQVIENFGWHGTLMSVVTIATIIFLWGWR